MGIFMPQALKKLIGHIAFGACVTLFVPTVTVKARVLKFHIWIPHKKTDPYFFLFPSYLPFWSVGPLNVFEKKSKKNLVSRISQKVFKLEA